MPLRRDWWRGANDPVLNTMMDRIARQNLSMEQALLRLKAAREDPAALAYRPTVEASGDIELDTKTGKQDTSSSFELGKAGIIRAYPLVDATWEVSLLGQAQMTRDITAATIAAAAADIDSIRGAVNAEAVNDYIDMRVAEHRQILLTQIADSRRSMAALVRIRMGAGFANTTDAENADMAVAKTEAALAETGNQVVQARYELAKLAGSSEPDVILDLQQKVPLFPGAIFADMPADVVRNRPDVRKLQQAVLTAAATRDLAHADLYPKLTLTGNVPAVPIVVGRSGSINESIGLLNLSLPLFDWGIRQAKIHQDDARLAESVSAYREGVITALAEVEQRRASCTAAAAQLAALQRSYDHARQIVTDTTLLKARGANDSIAVEMARIAAAEAEGDLTMATANAGKQYIALTLALGGGVAPTDGQAGETK